MMRGLWISAGALSPRMRAQEILANNLANAATDGFRQDRIAFRRMLADAGDVSGGNGADALTRIESGLGAAPQVTGRLDPTPGPLESTGNGFDLAVQGPGYLAVQGPEGELYTRGGSLRVGADGTLLHQSGFPLLTEGGVLTVPAGASLAVTPDGGISLDGQPAGRVRLVTLNDASGLRHAGAGLLSSDTPGEADTESRVLQGTLERSNVDPVQAMVEMMVLMREFEANQRSILAQDASVGRLINWAAGQ